MRAGKLGIIVTLSIAPLATCVSHVSVEGSPCPCPEDGLICCPSSGKCVASAATCPATYPPSSRTRCQNDGECLPDERCESWTVDGSPAGPGECRHACPDSIPCAEGEECELAPHDLHALQDLNVARICVSATPIAGCENLGCRDCSPNERGNTYCDENKVRGCFWATHPQCGLVCRSVLVSDCGERSCLVQDGVV